MRLYLNGRFLSQVTTGVQRMAREFTRALDSLIADGTLADVEAILLVQSNARFGDLELDRIAVREVRGARGHWWEQLLLPRHVDGGTLLNLGNTAPFVSLRGSGHVAVVLHDLSYRTMPEAYRWRYRATHKLIDWLIAPRVDTIITVSQTERAMIVRRYPDVASRIVVAQNGSWMGDRATMAPVIAGTEPYGLYVGSLSQRKNVDGVLATAVALARKRGLRFKLVGQGSAIFSDIVATIPADVRHLIKFCGQVDDQAELGALYRNAAFLLFPSFYEASALPPLEAMTQACPVIASDIPSLRERCGNAALYCDPHDLLSIEAAACEILDRPEHRRMLVERGTLHARGYSWRAQAEAIMAALSARAG